MTTWLNGGKGKRVKFGRPKVLKSKDIVAKHMPQC